MQRSVELLVEVMQVPKLHIQLQVVQRAVELSWRSHGLRSLTLLSRIISALIKT